MKQIWNIMILLVMMATYITACDVHEFPDASDAPAPETPHRIFVFKFDMSDMDIHTVIDINNWSNSRCSYADHTVRYIIEAYSLDEGSRTHSRFPLKRTVLTYKDIPENGIEEASVELELPPGAYRFVVWCDRTHPATAEADHYYNVENFSEISILNLEPGKYPGNDPMRNAYRGEVSAYIDPDGKAYDPSDLSIPLKVLTVEMVRPMARYVFETTDVEEFISKTKSADASGAGVPAANLSDYKVVFRYAGYLPTHYNALLDHPIDSRLGIWYEGDLKYLDATRAEMGGDFVFTNGGDTGVSVVAEIYDNAGRLISSSDPIDVPLKRNSLTIVRGRFLTSTVGTGVGISPGFDGSYDIEIK